MPFPYEFPFKFEEFTRILNLIWGQGRDLVLTSRTGSLLEITPSSDRVFSLGLNLSSLRNINSSVTRELNLHSLYKGGG